MVPASLCLPSMIRQIRKIAPLLLRQVGFAWPQDCCRSRSRQLSRSAYQRRLRHLWHGGFRTAPYFHNSVGILTEAASAKLMTASTVTREQLARSTTRGMRSALDATTNFPNPWPGGPWRPARHYESRAKRGRSVLLMAANYRSDYLRNFYET